MPSPKNRGGKMRYYVIGGDKDTITTKTKKCILNTTEYDTALIKFDKCMKEMIYDNIYLVVDFELYNKPTRILSPTISLYSNLDYTPFLILKEFHFDGKTRVYNILGNDIELVTDGFKQKFNNNVDAFNQYLYYYDKKEPCEMIIDGKKFASVIDDLRKDRICPLKKIQVSSPDVLKIPA